jgi:hypothetical protein
MMFERILTMQNDNIQCLHKRKVRFAIGIFSLYAIYAFVLVPLGTLFGSDIAYAGTMLLEITEMLYEIIELLAYVLAFATLINTRFCFGTSGGLQVFGIYVGAAAFRYVSIFLVSWKMNGVKVSQLGLELLFLLAYILLDVTQMTVALISTHLFCQKYERIFNVRQKALVARGEPVEDKLLYVVPYGGTVSGTNPLQISSIACGVIIMISRLVSRIIYDVSYGAPTSGADIAWMIFYYLGDITVSVLCCALIMLVIRRLDCRLDGEKTKASK